MKSTREIKKPLTVGSLFIVATMLSGCISGIKQAANYQPLTKPQPSLGSYTLAVLLPKDERGQRQDGNLKMKLGRAFPLVPYVTMVRERPELPSPNDLGYPPDFSALGFLQAGLTSEFQHAQMFKNVIAAREPGDSEQADFVLKPTLLSTKVTAWGSSYMMGLAALMYCGLNPLPMGGVYQELVLQLELTKAGSEKPVWMGTISETMGGRFHVVYYASKLARYYNGDGGSSGGFSISGADHNGQPLYDLLAKGMANISPALYNFFQLQPDAFWKDLRSGSPRPPSRANGTRSDSPQDTSRQAERKMTPGKN